MLKYVAAVGIAITSVGAALGNPYVAIADGILSVLGEGIALLAAEDDLLERCAGKAPHTRECLLSESSVARALAASAPNRTV